MVILPLSDIVTSVKVMTLATAPSLATHPITIVAISIGEVHATSTVPTAILELSFVAISVGESHLPATMHEESFPLPSVYISVGEYCHSSKKSLPSFLRSSFVTVIVTAVEICYYSSGRYFFEEDWFSVVKIEQLGATRATARKLGISKIWFIFIQQIFQIYGAFFNLFIVNR
jgi:hypothetical protein